MINPKLSRLLAHALANPELDYDATSSARKQIAAVGGKLNEFSTIKDLPSQLIEDLQLTKELHKMALIFTVDDSGKVLELVEEQPDGLVVRDNGDWTVVNEDEDNPTIFDQEWIDVSDEAIDFWDQAQTADKDVVVDDIMHFSV